MSIRHFVSLFKLNVCEELPVSADLSKTATNHVTNKQHYGLLKPASCHWSLSTPPENIRKPLLF